MSNGKGSKPRPLSVPYEQFAESWDNIFRPKAVREPMDDTNTHSTDQNNTHNDKRTKRKKRLRDSSRGTTDGNESSGQPLAPTTG